MLVAVSWDVFRLELFDETQSQLMIPMNFHVEVFQPAGQQNAATFLTVEKQLLESEEVKEEGEVLLLEPTMLL